MTESNPFVREAPGADRDTADDAPLAMPAAGRRLVVVSPTFAPEPLGTPMYAADTVAWLANAGWDVHVVTAQPFYPEFELYEGYGRATRRDRVDGVPVLRLPTIVPRGGQARWRLASDANFLVQGVLRHAIGAARRAPTVLSISPGSPLAALVGASARRRHGRHVCLVHDVQFGLASSLRMVRSERSVDLIRRVERFALRGADHVLALSEEMAGVVRDDMDVRRPVDVLPLWSTVATTSTTVPIGPVTDVQFSGNLGRKQGLEQLVALLGGLRSARPQTTFTVRGAGPLRGAVQSQLRRAGLGVEIEDPVETNALPAALLSSRVHIVPQLASTTAHVVPSKIVNALAMGGAVLAFATPGSPIDRMGQRCAAVRVVDPDDIDGAVAGVCELLDRHDPRTLRAAAIEYAAAHHDRERLLRRLHDVLLGDRAVVSQR